MLRLIGWNPDICPEDNQRGPENFQPTNTGFDFVIENQIEDLQAEGHTSQRSDDVSCPGGLLGCC